MALQRAWTLVVVAGIGLVPAVRAQQSSGSSSESASAQQQTEDDHSFPLDVSKKAAEQKTQQDQNAAQGASTADPQAPAPAPGKGAEDNPFPEDTSRKAADAKKAESDTSSDDAGTATPSGVSSSSDYDRRAGATGKNAVPVNVPMPHANGKDPVKEDINVGSFYLSSGDYRGAYARFKDAATQAPENTDAMFGLAEAARHLDKKDEALNNYQLFLDIVSSGSKAKEARKAVEALTRKP